MRKGSQAKEYGSLQKLKKVREWILSPETSRSHQPCPHTELGGISVCSFKPLSLYEFVRKPRTQIGIPWLQHFLSNTPPTVEPFLKTPPGSPMPCILLVSPQPLASAFFSPFLLPFHFSFYSQNINLGLIFPVWYEVFLFSLFLPWLVP